MTMKSEPPSRTSTSRTLDTSIETIRERIDKLGVSEPVIAALRPGRQTRSSLSCPASPTPLAVEDVIQSTAKLSKSTPSQPAVACRPATPIRTPSPANNGVTLPPDDELVHGVKGSAGSPEMRIYAAEARRRGRRYGLPRCPAPRTDINGRPNISFTLTTEAGDRFYKYTDAHKVHRRDRRWVHGHRARTTRFAKSPSIQSAIRDSRRDRPAAFTQQQADNLSLMLRTGALARDASPIIETRTVGPSLGAASIRQGVIAAIAGMARGHDLHADLLSSGAGINADLALAAEPA